MRSGLHKKSVTDKNGKRTTVWVKSDGGGIGYAKKKMGASISKKGKSKLTPLVEKIRGAKENTRKPKITDFPKNDQTVWAGVSDAIQMYKEDGDMKTYNMLKDRQWERFLVGRDMPKGFESKRQKIINAMEEALARGKELGGKEAKGKGAQVYSAIMGKNVLKELSNVVNLSDSEAQKLLHSDKINNVWDEREYLTKMLEKHGAFEGLK